MLIKEKYLDSFSSGIAQMMVIYARNGATGTLSIWDAIKDRFYSQDLGNMVDSIQRNIHRDNLLSSIEFQPSQGLIDILKQHEFEVLVSKFFDYYISRLPILLKVKMNHGGKRMKLSKKEIEAVHTACLLAWVEAYPETGTSYRFSGDYAKFDALMAWYVKSDRRDDALYSAEWLLGPLLRLYPDLAAGDNVGSVTIHVIESCFPMFWDSFQSHYFRNMFYYANLGWFVGDPDSELGDAMGRSDK